jgi:hypothetical protein
VDSGNPIRTFAGHDNALTSVVFSPDGKHVLTGSKDKIAILWDAQTGEAIRTFAHNHSVTSIAFSPDGTRILTGAEDCTAILWDTALPAWPSAAHSPIVAGEIPSWQDNNIPTRQPAPQERRGESHGSRPLPLVPKTTDQPEVLLNETFLGHNAPLPPLWGTLGTWQLAPEDTWQLASDGLHVTMPQSEMPAVAIRPDAAWRDYLLEFEFQHHSATFGCFVRFTDPTNSFYAVRLTRGFRKGTTTDSVLARVTRVYPTALNECTPARIEETVLSVGSCVYGADKFIRLSLRVTGKTLELSINGRHVLKAEDKDPAPPMAGGIALGAVAENGIAASAIVRNLRVTRIPAKTDGATPPVSANATSF